MTCRGGNRKRILLRLVMCAITPRGAAPAPVHLGHAQIEDHRFEKGILDSGDSLPAVGCFMNGAPHLLKDARQDAPGISCYQEHQEHDGVWGRHLGVYSLEKSVSREFRLISC